VDDDAVKWATQEIIAFIKQEEKRGLLLAEQVQNDPFNKPLLDKEPYLIYRIMCADPPPSP
jgi:hypothetical protein